MAEKRVNYSSGAPLEEKVGYSRMVKVGDHIYVGGTTSVQPDGTVYGENAYEQTRYVLEKQVKLIEQAGAGVGDVCCRYENVCRYIKGIFRDIS